jgi:uncharacterized membrane protein
MEKAYIVACYLHIIAGIAAFFVAPVALIAKKGGRMHIFWGNLFFYAMLLAAFTALLITIYQPNTFLFLVAIFSVHLSVSGYRASAARKIAKGYMHNLIDKGIAYGSLTTYMILTGWGVYVVLLLTNTDFGYIAMVFGAVGLRFSVSQVYKLYKPSTEKMDWWYLHMQGMVGAYIAAVSAFSAVNFYFLPPLVRWLWPTVIGSIGLTVWVGYYRKKFRKLSTDLTTSV